MAGAGYKSWVDGDVLSANDVNTYLMEQAVMVFADSTARDAALTAPSEGMFAFTKDDNAFKFYTGSAWQSVTALNFDGSIVATEQNTTSTSYTDLTTVGPSATVTTGTKALVFVKARLTNSTAGQNAYMGCAISGASTVAAADSQTLNNRPSDSNNPNIGMASMIIYTGLTAGSNTFTAKYRTSGGTATFVNREIFVLDLGS